MSDEHETNGIYVLSEEPYPQISYETRADYTAEELIKVLEKDAPYYLMSGGGVTFGGGEPLLQADFIHEVCGKMDSSWKKTIETSLNVDWNLVEQVIDDMDYWYVDIKDFNPSTYKKYTGKENTLTMENLLKLVNVVSEEKICIRVPYIPGFNTKEHQEDEVAYIRENISSKVDIDIFDYTKIYYKKQEPYDYERKKRLVIPEFLKQNREEKEG